MILCQNLTFLKREWVFQWPHRALRVATHCAHKLECLVPSLRKWLLQIDAIIQQWSWKAICPRVATLSWWCGAVRSVGNNQLESRLVQLCLCLVCSAPVRLLVEWTQTQTTSPERQTLDSTFLASWSTSAPLTVPLPSSPWLLCAVTSMQTKGQTEVGVTSKGTFHTIYVPFNVQY